MSFSEERKEVSNENELLEIRVNQAEAFLYKEMEDNSKTAFLVLFLLIGALLWLYISWFNFWSIVLTLFILFFGAGVIFILQDNKKHKKYLELIYTDVSILEEVEKLMQIKKAENAKKEAIKKQNDEIQALSHPKCPNCGSTNTKQISNVNRVASVAMWGLASSKIGKQYQCNRCNHKW